MPKEDYLLKYLEKLSQIVRAMFGFREKGFPQDALRLADETYSELLNFKSNELAEMPIEQFVEMVRRTGYNAPYLEALAKVAFETAHAYQLLQNEKYAKCFFQKSLQLYVLLNEKDKTFSFEREMMIAQLSELAKNNYNFE